MARSDIDKATGDLLRAGLAVTCPHCGTTAIWRVAEYQAHRNACARIELGLIVGKLATPGDLVPEVAEKPKGWGWSR